MGSTIIRLRRLACRFKMEPEIDTAFAAVAAGKSGSAMAYLAPIECEFAENSKSAAEGTARLRASGGVRAISHTLSRYGGYFDGTE
jgi:hypothetical protein